MGWVVFNGVCDCVVTVCCEGEGEGRRERERQTKRCFPRGHLD